MVADPILSWPLACSRALLALATLLMASAATNERLIGWRGEVHSVLGNVNAPVLKDRRQGCADVGVGVGEGLVVQRPEPIWLYRYPLHEGLPRYTHMAMVTQLPNGTLLAAWQAADHGEGTSDQHLVTCTSLDDRGLHWAAPAKLDVVGDGEHPLWGPTFLVDTRRGALWLFYSQNSGNCRGGPMDWAPGGNIKAIRYNLHTERWDQPKLLLSQDTDGGIPKVSANKAIELSTGEFVLPFWRENALIGNNQACKKLVGKQGAGVLISEDRGATWKAHGQLVTKGSWLIENALTELADGRLMMVFRTRVQRIHVSYSSDKGRTWSASQPLAEFRNPNSKVDLLRLQPHGELAIAYNDHIAPNKDPDLSHQGCTKCRTYLKVAISHDGGATWRNIAYLESEVAPTLRFHYPTLQQVGCELVVAYSQFHKRIDMQDNQFTRQGIKLARVSLL